MRSHLPGQSDSAGPSVVCVSGHAKKLVRLGDTKSGSGAAATLVALAASCMRACVQQDATGALGTCIRTRMRARQTHAEERGEKGGQRSRHTLDAPVALEYLPATHRPVHVAADDEVDP